MQYYFTLQSTAISTLQCSITSH
uniref:Uncharacterized protein n=1 Tax=Anguilla anguilla TaxID=7936 RepID=A0A0E9PCK8_ANGAN